MGLFYPMLLVPDVYPPPPQTWLVLAVLVFLDQFFYNLFLLMN